MSDPYLPPFSGHVPHPPGYVCGALCTPWCVDGVTPEPVAAAATGFETLAAPVPAPRAAPVTAPSA